MLDLETLLRQLRQCGIKCGVATAPPSHIVAYMEVEGRPAERKTFYAADRGAGRKGDIARWLHDKALEHYPDSEYAREHRPTVE